jgi:hypothetical protein
VEPQTELPAVAIAAEPVVKQLEYDNKTTLITRRQMRFFLLLLTVNTFLFASFICLPSASPFLKQAWEDYQRKRTEAAEKAKMRRLIEACMNYSAPADQVVYAEQPAAADALLARAGHAYLLDGLFTANGGGGLFGGGGRGGGGGGAGGGGGLYGRSPVEGEAELDASGWHPPAAQGSVAPLIALASSNLSSGGSLFQEMRNGSVIFLHQLTTPAGIKRLVWVSINAKGRISLQPNGSALPEYSFSLGRCFTATVMDEDADNPVVTTAIFESAATDKMQLISKPENKAELKNKSGYWRVFAGQIDASDPSHLTFAYDIDGHAGVIDGWLKDGDRLMLEPRAGRLIRWNSGAEYVWDVSESAATKPVK